MLSKVHIHLVLCICVTNTIYFLALGLNLQSTLHKTQWSSINFLCLGEVPFARNKSLYSKGSPTIYHVSNHSFLTVWILILLDSAIVSFVSYWTMSEVSKQFLRSKMIVILHLFFTFQVENWRYRDETVMIVILHLCRLVLSETSIRFTSDLHNWSRKVHICMSSTTATSYKVHIYFKRGTCFFHWHTYMCSKTENR